MADYIDQMAFWRECPPTNISLAIIARAHGAKFDKAPRAAGPSGPTDQAPMDPEALAASLGLSGVGVYRRPQMGLPLPADNPNLEGSS